MASNKAQRFGPVALTTTLTTNILNPAAAGANAVGGYTATATYFIIRHVRIVNKTASAATFTLYIGATGANVAGTEFMGVGQSVAANAAYDWYGMVRMDAADFLVGGSNTAVALTLDAEGEVGLS
jgi:hypothetical protein